MKINSKSMSKNELYKSAQLIMFCIDNEIDFSDDAIIDVNIDSGNVYLYSENLPYTVFIGLDDNMYLLIFENENNEEIIMSLEEINEISVRSLQYNINTWVNIVEQQIEQNQPKEI
jgi:hypothetical protein